MAQEGVCYVDTWAQAQSVCAGLSDAGVVAFDMEGVQLGQKHGRLTLLQVARDEHTVFCFDVLKLGGAELFDLLGPILGSPRIIKLCFDCRVDGDVLWRQYGVRLSSVYDIQVLYTLLFQARSDRFLKGLAHVLQVPGIFPGAQMLDQVLGTKRRMKSLMAAQEDLFMQRPIAGDLLEYCGADVSCLLRMHRLWGHRWPQEEVIKTSMARLIRFIDRPCEVPPPRSMSLIDFRAIEADGPSSCAH